MNKKYKIKNRQLLLNLIIMICIIISVFGLAIGYAEMNSINLDIALNITVPAKQGMFISNVTYLSSVDADITNSEIISYTDTMLHSNIYLSSITNNSSITYEVTITNNSDSNKKFTGVTYEDGFYSNQYISYSLNGIAENDTINKGESKTFEIMFYYNSSNISNNQLDSYLNFNFDYYFDEENDVDIYIDSNESYTFAGVTAENPVNLQNITNISFMVMNGSEQSITGLQVDVTYSTSTGSKQSATVTLYDGNNATLATQEVQFQGKQNNRVSNIVFNNISVATGEKLSIKFSQGNTTNGQVNISNVVITPIF